MVCIYHGLQNDIVDHSEKHPDNFKDENCQGEHPTQVGLLKNIFKNFFDGASRTLSDTFSLG